LRFEWRFVDLRPCRHAAHAMRIDFLTQALDRFFLFLKAAILLIQTARLLFD
jgi:hypothetical protein